MITVRDQLADWTREELVDLVERLVHAEYSLFGLLEIPPPGRGLPVDPVHLTTQIDIAFQPAMRGGWREALALGAKMEEMAELGFRYLERGEAETALTVFTTVSTAVLDRVDQVSEDESEVGISVDRCMEGLGECLAQADEDDARAVILDAVLELTVLGQARGVGDQGHTLLLKQTTRRERRNLLERAGHRITPQLRADADGSEDEAP